MLYYQILKICPFAATLHQLNAYNEDITDAETMRICCQQPIGWAGIGLLTSF